MPVMSGEEIRVRGLVQGVGFRPAVWRLARDCGLIGEVWNDAEGVLIRAWGEPAALARFLDRLHKEPPPLARIDRVEHRPLAGSARSREFLIVPSRGGAVRTGVVPDAATCAHCRSEVFDPRDRRYRYPFTNCTHCGPRLTIVRAIPYDRGNTSMDVFPMCPNCRAEYEDPGDRRFHAQPNACPVCGPRMWLENAPGVAQQPPPGQDVIALAAQLIKQGAILAVKGLGGFHLACDATDAEAVARLRQRKHRFRKAFALMARDLDMVRRYARIAPQEQALLQDSAAPIVILDALAHNGLAPQVAPGQNGFGFMLPYTPLHHLLLARFDHPIVLTSGNRSDEPQCTDNQEARHRLSGLADYWLLHDRDILNRLDDSVLRVMDGRSRFLRRARGFAPAPLRLPAGFQPSPPVLAMGGELKNSFCLLAHGQATLSQHIGDLEDAATHRDYRRNLDLYRRLFEFAPAVIAVDSHPNYLSSQWGREWAHAEGLVLAEVQHHHAHIAGCMAEHRLPPDTGPVLGIALDGLGYGEDGTIWGAEFLRADYREFQRLAHFRPVAMLGGSQAIREPWRNSFAYLASLFGWNRFVDAYPGLELSRFLRAKPVAALLAMLEKGINSPRASSAGRLFDAVAAAIGICRATASHEGQAAMELEALAEASWELEAGAYPHEIVEAGAIPMLQWRPLWVALLDDLCADTAPSVMAVRFHRGLISGVSEMAERLCRRDGLDTVVLGGGVFQNRLLLEGVCRRLRSRELEVLSPELVPANDGGLALGQAVVAAARTLQGP
jgi:hydrogenase maturation protein HypF